MSTALSDTHGKARAAIEWVAVHCEWAAHEELPGAEPLLPALERLPGVEGAWEPGWTGSGPSSPQSVTLLIFVYI